MKSLLSFLAVGAFSSALNAAIYAGLIFLGWHYAAAVIAAFVVCVPVGYALNRQLTFQSNVKVSKSFPRVVAIYLAQQAFMILAIGVMVDGMHLGQIIAYAIATPPAVAFSFLTMKRLGFR